MMNVNLTIFFHFAYLSLSYSISVLFLKPLRKYRTNANGSRRRDRCLRVMPGDLVEVVVYLDVVVSASHGPYPRVSVFPAFDEVSLVKTAAEMYSVSPVRFFTALVASDSLNDRGPAPPLLSYTHRSLQDSVNVCAPGSIYTARMALKKLTSRWVSAPQRKVWLSLTFWSGGVDRYRQ